MTGAMAIVWKDQEVEGRITLVNGAFSRMNDMKIDDEISQITFSLSESESPRLELSLREVGGLSACPTIITVETAGRSFSFFTRDVSRQYPIYIAQYGICVTTREDLRTFGQIESDIRSRGLRTRLHKINDAPEETYEKAANQTQHVSAPTWLGLSRDARLFEIGFRSGGDGGETHWDWIQPRFHGRPAPLPETDDKPVRFRYLLGRGIGCRTDISRRLEEGILPILHANITDNDIVYRSTSFVSYERQALHESTLAGTHYLVADGYGIGATFTPEQAGRRAELLAAVRDSEDETVLYSRVEATNGSRVPRYAWFRNPEPNCNYMNNHVRNYTFDSATGFVQFSADRVVCVSKLNGRPLAHEEMAVLIAPGETVVIEFFVPHRPLSHERALALARQDVAARLEECRNFWKRKLSRAASIRLPERRVEEMMNAGLLHLDLITYGLEPHAPVVPAIGMYTAIGSESSPIIQYMDSMGWHDLARRSIHFFLEKQHEDGLMQNFGGYMLETGAMLWTIGEHYRYTRDEAWVQQIKPNLLAAYGYLARWRERNLREDLVGKGYGMLEGKVADPEDPYRSFMLNGYAYLGLSRLAEMLELPDPALSAEVRRTADELKRDILDAFARAAAQSPVVPLGDGSWVPSAPPWVEYRGPVSLFAEGGKWLSHGSFFCRDSMLGPLYLVFHEIIDPNHPYSDFMLNYHNELMCAHNVALSQPYYSMHPWVHLRRKEVKAFLQAYYNGFAGLADRETYTFWEHHWGLSPHKTHEEAWFLMQSRWMLFMEDKDALHLFPGIPGAWLENGNQIRIDNVGTYFGPVSVHVESRLEQGTIAAKLVFHNRHRKPAAATFRLPHPEGRKPVRISAGSRSEDGIITIHHPGNIVEITLQF